MAGICYTAPMKSDKTPLLFALIITSACLLLLIILDRDDSTWLPATSLPEARRVMCAVTHGDNLYVIGGVDAVNRYRRDTLYSRLGSDGRVGHWQRTAALVTERFYHACVSYRDWIYVLGGGGGPLGDENRPLASVERARVRPDGSLEPWQQLGNMVLPRRGVTAVQRGQWLYAIGGYDGRFLKSTERAQLLADGRLGPWQLEPQQASVDRYIHATTAAADRLILLGGHMRSPNTPSHGDVETSRIGPDGHLAPWRVSSSALLEPRFMASAVSLGRHVYLLGGHNGVARLASVEYAPLNLFMEPEDWQTGPALPQALSGSATLAWRDLLYVIGGAGEMGLSVDVWVTRQAADGNLQAPW